MRQFWILAKKDTMELLRTKKVLIIAIAFFLFALVSPILAEITPQLLNSLDSNITIDVPDATIVDSYAQFIGNITQISLWVMIIAISGLIVNERRKGLYNNLLNNGVKPRNFILSKVLTQIGMVTDIFIISCLLFSIVNIVIFNQALITHSILSFITVYVYLIFVICLTNFFGAFAKSTAITAMLTIGLTLLLALFELFRFGRYLPNHLIMISSGVLTDNSFLDIAYWNIAITLALSIILVLASIKVCKIKN